MFSAFQLRQLNRAIVSTRLLKNSLGKYICFNVFDKKGNMGFSLTEIISSKPPEITIEKDSNRLVVNSNQAVSSWQWRESTKQEDCNLESHQNPNNWQTRKALGQEFNLIVPIPDNLTLGNWYCFIIETKTEQKIHSQINLSQTKPIVGSVNQTPNINPNGPSRNTLLILTLVVSTLLIFLRQKPVNL